MPSERLKGILTGAIVSAAVLIGGFGAYRYLSPATSSQFDGGSGDEYYNEPDDPNALTREMPPGTKPTGNFWEPNPNVTQQQIDKALAPTSEEQKRQQLIDENLRLQNEALKHEKVMEERRRIQENAEHNREIFRRGHTK